MKKTLKPRIGQQILNEVVMIRVFPFFDTKKDQLMKNDINMLKNVSGSLIDPNYLIMSTNLA
jgi:hypothetical protein